MKMLIKAMLVFISMLLIGSCDNSTENNGGDNGSDTTSHEFVWEKFTFGETDGSSLNDAAIIDENNIWAVGEIYMKDSLGNYDPVIYNIAHWDGVKWELKRASVEFMGNIITPRLYGIHAFSENDIWMTSGLAVHWDGKSFIQYDFRVGLDQSLVTFKLWGKSTSDMYFAGPNGSMVHYNGSAWKKIETGTTLQIYDIWGDTDDKGNTEILCLASNLDERIGAEILEIKADAITGRKDTAGMGRIMHSVWFEKDKKYYATGGDGIYIKDNLEEEKWKNIAFGITQYFPFRVRGNAANDVIIAGAYGELLHYNGKSWRSYIEQTYFNGNLVSVDIKGDITCAVGAGEQKACVYIGRRK